MLSGPCGWFGTMQKNGTWIRQESGSWDFLPGDTWLPHYPPIMMRVILQAPDPVEQVSCRPDFSILVYPVISFTEDFQHSGSRSKPAG